jgi:DNA-binding transcriptional regulator LsrR (DeoR family)
MVYQKYSLGLSNAEIARRLNVDRSTVSRAVQLFEETGTVSIYIAFKATMKIPVRN